MKKIFILISGIILGIILTFFLIKINLSTIMISTRASKYELEETVSRLEEQAYLNNWEVLHTYDIGDCLFDQDFSTTYMKIEILSICQPEFSYAILQEDENKFISAIMPCRIAIYEDKEGDVYISRMNIGLFSNFFSGTIGDILANVAEDDKKIISDVIKNPN